MPKTLKEIARLIGGEIVGEADVVISGVAGIKEARRGEITFLANHKYFPLIDKTSASAIITSLEVARAAKPIIRVENPSLAFIKIVNFFSGGPERHFKGVHPSAVLGKGVSLGKDVAIGASAVIGEGVSIGSDSVIYPGVFVGAKSKIGNDTLIYPNVSIRENTIIGSRVIIHSGAVIGSDGFGFIPVEGKHHKIPQVGIVEIGDDVEIGANAAIDRARFDKTVIGCGTKIDNLVHIAHNVVLGENCIIIAQAGVSGSTTIGKGATLAGQAGLVGHINIGEGAIVAAQAGVTKSVPANTIVSGYPAQEHELAKRVNACVQNLPRLYETVRKLQKKIQELETKLKA
ncbi:MAG: UDP-3-O-(3-hydroxymyristoyl)glucosamine N-acyltransferase [Candidatus Omnitrophota bacterium]